MALPFCYEKIKIPSQKGIGANILVVQSIGVLHMRPCCNRRGCLPCLAALVAGILLAMLLPPWLCFVIIMAVLVCLCLL